MSILAGDLAKWLQTATSTTKLTLFHSIRLARLVRSCFIKTFLQHFCASLRSTQARLGNDDEARKMFNLAIVADEKHPHAWQAWGVMEQQRGNFIVAKKLFEKVSE
tara:strand:- start:678 stop:995 length:318 start_codon:yes stop_codon:yes gene_type:complete